MRIETRSRPAFLDSLFGVRSGPELVLNKTEIATLRRAAAIASRVRSQLEPETVVDYEFGRLESAAEDCAELGAGISLRYWGRKVRPNGLGAS